MIFNYMFLCCLFPSHFSTLWSNQGSLPLLHIGLQDPAYTPPLACQVPSLLLRDHISPQEPVFKGCPSVPFSELPMQSCLVSSDTTIGIYLYCILYFLSWKRQSSVHIFLSFNIYSIITWAQVLCVCDYLFMYTCVFACTSKIFPGLSWWSNG